MKRLVVLIVIFVLLFSLIPTGSVAFADTSVYSDVLDDLQLDASFDAANYVSDETDFSLQLFQIAESIDNELLVYVYQPSGSSKNLHATSISMSLRISGFDDRINPSIYYLEFLNSDGVFFKYKVKDFVVLNDSIRYYEIYTIYRPFINGDPLPNGSGQTVNERGFNVGLRFTCGQINGTYTISCKAVKTVEITSMFVGFVRYRNSVERSYVFWGSNEDEMDSHFVAFSTSENIDRLLEAKVFYKSQFFEKDPTFYPDGVYGEIEEHEVEFAYTDQASFTSSGWFDYGTYTWGRIQTVDQFVEGEDHSNLYNCGLFNVETYSHLTEEAIDELQDYQYVLRFAETDYREFRNVAQGHIGERRFIVSEVTILRLKYEYANQIYDLGVVSNKQTGSLNPLNESITEVEFSDEIKDLFRILLIALAVIALLLLLKFLLPIFKAIWWVITLPFKLFRKLLGLGQEAHPQSTEQSERNTSKYRYRR